jgi:SAM-dependent methyltransferase
MLAGRVATPGIECHPLECGDPLQGIPFESGDTVLDLGCDAASNLPRVAPLLGQGGHFIGIDNNASVSDEGASTLPRTDFIKADPTALPVGDGAVDWVVSCCGLTRCSDPGRACQEIGRVLKPIGRVSAVEFAASHSGPERPTASGQVRVGFSESDYLEALGAAGLGNVHIVDRYAPSRPELENTIGRSDGSEVRVGAVWIIRILGAKAPPEREDTP